MGGRVRMGRMKENEEERARGEKDSVCRKTEGSEEEKTRWEGE
jgi:hypothetical protein